MTSKNLHPNADKPAKDYTVNLSPENQPLNGRKGCEYRTLGHGMHDAAFARACATNAQRGAKVVSHAGGTRVKRVYEVPKAVVRKTQAARLARRDAAVPSRSGK